VSAPALDRRLDRVDICPGCGGERQELPEPAEVFYCEECKRGTIGPNAEAPTPKQPEPEGLF